MKKLRVLLVDDEIMIREGFKKLFDWEAHDCEVVGEAFLPAGTLSYKNGWLFIALLFIPMICFGAVLLARAPELLEKRLHTKESQSEQKLAILLSALLFVAVFVIAGMDYRFGWTRVPTVVVIFSALFLLAGYGMYMEVMRENAWLSRTVEIQKDQKVIDTGLYGIVRHPMYLATIILFLAMPLVLGSWISFVLMLLYPAVLVIRIAGEEKVPARVSRHFCSCVFAILCGGHAIFPGENFIKIALIMVPGLFSNVRNTQVSFVQKLSGLFQTDILQIFRIGHAGFLFDQSVKIIFLKMKQIHQLLCMYGLIMRLNIITHLFKNNPVHGLFLLF